MKEVWEEKERAWKYDYKLHGVYGFPGWNTLTLKRWCQGHMYTNLISLI